MQATIERTITINAEQERVYQMIADPEQITQWFPSKVLEGTLEQGQTPVFEFTEQNHRARIYVEATKPHEYFAYSWVPGGDSSEVDPRTVPHTLVEFRLEKSEAGTKVTLRESGFSKLPEADAQVRFGQNSGGWEYMMGRLEKAFDEV